MNRYLKAYTVAALTLQAQGKARQASDMMERRESSAPPPPPR